jgi:hypothetical protein
LAVVVVTPAGAGSGDGFGVGPGVGVGVGVAVGGGVGPGSGCGCGVGPPPQLPERWLFSACTSTSCPPEHGAALWGWLLPGPCSDVLSAAPFFSAICPAVWPFPYCFVLSDCASACVSSAVSFDGFTPVAFAGAPAAGAAVVVVTAAPPAPSGRSSS